MHQHTNPELRDINGRYRLAVEPPAPAPEPPPSTRRATQAGFASAAPAWLGRRPSERGEK